MRERSTRFFKWGISRLLLSLSCAVNVSAKIIYRECVLFEALCDYGDDSKNKGEEGLQGRLIQHYCQKIYST